MLNCFSSCIDLHKKNQIKFLVLMTPLVSFFDSMSETRAVLTWSALSEAWALESYANYCWRKTWRFEGEKTTRWAKPPRGIPSCRDNHERCLQSTVLLHVPCTAAGGGGSALLRCSTNDQSPQERGAAEGGAPSAGPGQNTLHRAERRL